MNTGWLLGRLKGLIIFGAIAIPTILLFHGFNDWLDGNRWQYPAMFWVAWIGGTLETIINDD